MVAGLHLWSCQGYGPTPWGGIGSCNLYNSTHHVHLCFFEHDVGCWRSCVVRRFSDKCSLAYQDQSFVSVSWLNLFQKLLLEWWSAQTLYCTCPHKSVAENICYRSCDYSQGSWCTWPTSFTSDHDDQSMSLWLTLWSLDVHSMQLSVWQHACLL